MSRWSFRNKKDLVKSPHLHCFFYMTIILSKPENTRLKQETKIMVDAAEAMLKDKAKVRKFMIKKGFITKSGKLARHYR